MRQITSDEAILIFENQLYEDWTNLERVQFQLFQRYLAMPLNIFRTALEDVFDRPVETIEFANGEKLRNEFLGLQDPPTFEEIIALIPKGKRYLFNIQE